MRPRMVRSPVDICLGTRPIHAEKSRPLANAAPLPIAATIALEMIGPMPGTVITLRQPSSLFAKVSISSVVEFRLAQLAVASVVPLPRRLVPGEALRRRHGRHEVHADEARPGPRLGLER